MDNLNLGSLN
uniref:Uncharacterized protein n=1 Tax=Arundo donax TaxID=35708 RepID=A0A0A9G4I4_ARUDO